MPKRLLFIHHSTGGNLIQKGKLRDLLYSKTDKVEFWDHGYNLFKNFSGTSSKSKFTKLMFRTGLSDKNGRMTGEDFQIQLSNNTPADFENIFCANYTKNETLKKIFEFDIIAFKNCFPATKIDSDEKLEKYKDNYNNMSEAFKTYPNKIFIAFTPPPLRKEMTKHEYSKRAKTFAKWLSTEWKKPKNVFVFDFFKLLSDKDGFLKKRYCSLIPLDSHPNTKANLDIAPEFVNLIIKLSK